MYKILIYLYKFFPKVLRVFIIKKTAYFWVNKYADVTVKGFANVPKNEPVIFISNHLSNLDGLLLAKIFEENKIETYFLAGVKLKGEALTNAILEIVPHIEIEPNKPDRKAIKKAVSHLKNKKSILIFPEGTRSRTGAMIKGRSGVYLIAKMAGVKIVPLGISGTEKCLPIEESGNMSKESFVHSKIDIVFGKPFLLEDLPGKEEPVDEMMIKVAELLPLAYRGYYS